MSFFSEARQRQHDARAAFQSPPCAAPCDDWRKAVQLAGPRYDDERYLYLFEIVGLAVKVGITANPRTRIGNHVHAASVHGREIGRVWISPAHLEALHNENIIKGEPGASEYLERSMSELMLQAMALPMTRFNGSQVRKGLAIADCLMMVDGAIVDGDLPLARHFLAQVRESC